MVCRNSARNGVVVVCQNEAIDCGEIVGSMLLRSHRIDDDLLCQEQLRYVGAIRYCFVDSWTKVFCPNLGHDDL